MHHRDLAEEFRNLFPKFVKGDISGGELLEFRAKLGDRMGVTLAYADCFRIYEYALNRVERRFDTELKPTGYSDEDMVQALMAYLSSAGDSARTNERIREIIGQLPVRFTRQKYYSMVRDALSVYIGADRQGLKNVMYLLRTGSMSELSEEKLHSEPMLYELLEGLRQVSFRELTSEGYRDAQAKITIASEALNESSDALQLMEEMVNDMYLLVLTGEDAIYDVTLREHAYHIMSGLAALWTQERPEIPQELEDELQYLEGVQEESMDRYQRLESVPEDMTGEDARRGRVLEKLMSNSSFAELDESPEDAGSIGQQDVDRACDAYILASEPVLRASQKPVSRAIMATSLSVLPVCFNSLEEIRRYIEGSLASCVDLAEKETCKELLIKMMESETDAVL
jgi:hypothetical protein